MSNLAVAHGAELSAYTEDQKLMIRNTFANGASPQEFEVLWAVAVARKLNPIMKQIYFVKRWTKDRGEVWSTQISIDGMRALAERTGKYDGQDEPTYEEGPGGVPTKCTVRVYRKDWSRPAVGVAYYSEYVQKTKDQRPTRFWSEMPHVMLAKCAESLAMRKAFPEDMSGLYTPEEMQQADNAPAHDSDGVVIERPKQIAEPSPEAFQMLMTLLERKAFDDFNKLVSQAKSEGVLSDGQLASLRTAYANAKNGAAAA